MNNCFFLICFVHKNTFTDSLKITIPMPRYIKNIYIFAQSIILKTPNSNKIIFSFHINSYIHFLQFPFWSYSNKKEHKNGIRTEHEKFAVRNSNLTWQGNIARLCSVISRFGYLYHPIRNEHSSSVTLNMENAYLTSICQTSKTISLYKYLDLSMIYAFNS